MWCIRSEGRLQIVKYNSIKDFISLSWRKERLNQSLTVLPNEDPILYLKYRKLANKFGWSVSRKHEWAWTHPSSHTKQRHRSSAAYWWGLSHMNIRSHRFLSPDIEYETSEASQQIRAISFHEAGTWIPPAIHARQRPRFSSCRALSCIIIWPNCYLSPAAPAGLSWIAYGHHAAGVVVEESVDGSP